MLSSWLDATWRRARSARAALAIFLLLAVAHTWPLARNPAHLSRVDNGDYLLNVWAVSWVAHELPRDPVHLFDANIFYPERRTLAYSEAMIVQGVMAMPLRAVGLSPIATYSVLFLAGLALTGWAFCLLIRRWTGSWSAAYIGGSLAAFNASVLVRTPHLQTQHAEFVPLMLFALDRMIMSPRMRSAALLGAGFALQGLTSIYLLVFSTWMLGFAALARLVSSGAAAGTEAAAGATARRRVSRLRILVLLGAAGAIACGILAPYLLAYVRLHEATGLERTVGDAELYAGSWTDYLSTGGRLHYWLWSHRFFERSRSASFPGIAGIALAGLGLAWAETRRDPRLRMCLAAGSGCALVSWAAYLPFYPALHRAIPLFRAVRVAAHLGQFVLMMLAVAAGFGAAGLARRWPARSWRAAALVLFGIVHLEALRAPIGFREFGQVSRVYDRLAATPRAIVAEVPFFSPRFTAPMAMYMLNSTAHWHPILEGYSGFVPQSYLDTYDVVRNFPDERSLFAMHTRGVTHVVVHRSAIEPEQFAAVERTASLRPIDNDGETYLYVLR